VKRIEFSCGLPLALQGRKVLRDFDVTAAAGGKFRPVVKTFHGVHLDANQPIVAEFPPSLPAGSEPMTAPVLSGIELILE
jgi:hypothetical protein